jgi:phosphoribosyl 1,2-cyclic phosphodiesterase
MRFACLGSGSRGNATLIEGGGVRLLVDCGFAVRELERRLVPLGVALNTLEAVLVTHEHGDHIRGVPALSRKLRLPLWMTRGTCSAAGCSELEGLNLFYCHGGGFQIGGLRVEPYAIPHDAREPCQFLFRSDGLQLGMLTDSGSVTPHIVECLRSSDALLLECNHDPQMLARGPYPPRLRRRVGGAYGHLSNDQAAALLGRIDASRLRHLVAAHLSEKNNRPDKVRETLLCAAAALEGRLTVATQERATGWLEM